MADDELLVADRLVLWLEDIGFERTSATESVIFDNVGFSLTRKDFIVSISRDRGDWFISLGGAGTVSGEIGQWIACLENRPADLAPLSLVELGRLLKEHLNAFEELAKRPGLRECLKSRGIERSEALMAQIRSRGEPK